MKTNTHTRACPECGKIIPWTKGKKFSREYMGRGLTVYEMHLICPKHGEFRNPAEKKALRDF